jgi:hypothetical protein
MTVPTTLPIRTAYQGRSFTPPMETLGSSISPVVEYSSLPLVRNI